ncbi:hypothetical protein [Roseovarius phycicola]|uniref:SseB protein N-terminal domain-containing protein n=1 Tax=Roseovarius phycicola TaxID=3080976 RepID=A0ABZ2HR63_9RHOB
MKKTFEKLEKIRKGLLKPDEPSFVPGQKEKNGSVLMFFCVPSNSKGKKVFRQLTAPRDYFFAKAGGAIEGNCRVTTPDGRVFFSLSFRGDLDGWKKTIETAAVDQNIVLAYVSENELIISDKTSLSLEECVFEFN